MGWINVRDILPPDPKELHLVAIPFCRKRPNSGEKISKKNSMFFLGYFSPNSGWDVVGWDGEIDVEWWMRIPETPDLVFDGFDNG